MCIVKEVPVAVLFGDCIVYMKIYSSFMSVLVFHVTGMSYSWSEERFETYAALLNFYICCHCRKITKSMTLESIQPLAFNNLSNLSQM